MNIVSEHCYNFEIFSGLTQQQIQQIINVGILKNLKKGEILLKESDTGEEVFLILEGLVSILINVNTPDNFEEITTLKPGAIVGESILFGKKRRTAQVVAKTNIEALIWNKDNLLNFLDNNKNIGYIFVKNIAYNLVLKLEEVNFVLRNIKNQIPISFIL